MMKARTSLWASLAIAASLGLAGCGGSSDNDDTGATTPATPATPAPPVALDLPVGNNIRDRLDQDDENQTDDFLDSKSATIAAGSTWDYGGVRFSCPAGGSACTVSFSTDLSGVTATTGGEGSGTATAALLSTVGTGVGLATLREEITTPPSASPNKRSRDLGFPEADTARDGTTAFVSRHLKDPKGFTQEASYAAAAVPSAWKGGPWEGEAWKSSDGNETLVRFDNQAPGMTFAKKYGEYVDDSNNVQITEAQFGATPEVRRAAFWDLVRTATPIFPGRTGPAPVDAVTTSGVPAYSISAIFDGVAGTLTCVSGCTLTAEGTKLQGGTTDGWTFTATSASAAVTGAGDRDDYLAFGWWREDNDSGGGFAAFEPVYGGRVPFPIGVDVAANGTVTAGTGTGTDINTPQNLNGKATYEGGAAGNYTDYSGRRAPQTNPNPSGDDSEDRPDRHGGWFVADAKLTASFGNGGTTTNANDNNQITGTISNFRGTHGSLGAWKVMLGSGTALARGNLADQQAYLVGVHNGTATLAPLTGRAVAADVGGNADGDDWTGSWGVNFYGSPRDGGANDKLPSGVAGWFSADTGSRGTSGVAVQGSFAASRQP